MTAVASEGPDPVGMTPVASSVLSPATALDACCVPQAVQNFAPSGSADWQLSQIRSLNPSLPRRLPSTMPDLPAHPSGPWSGIVAPR